MGLTCTTTLSQSEPESNGNKGVLHIPQSSGTEPSPSDCLVISRTLIGRVLPLVRDAVSVFYSPSQLDFKISEGFYFITPSIMYHIFQNWKFSNK